jgi:glycosyltransferase involved in cell wall biosynthesis
MTINYLYKLSDKGRPKAKLNIATKMNCLDNFIAEFKTNIHVLADNCEESTLEEIRKRGIEPIVLALGNALNMRYAIQYAIDNFSKDSYVYIVEDDYIHLPNSLNVLLEGLQVADYVSLYDNPDKYMNAADGGPNPYIEQGGEQCRVLLTKSSHWKSTNSVTMTFATSVKVLEEDKHIWWKFTETKVPHSFLAFKILTRQKFLFTKEKSIRKFVRSLRDYRQDSALKASSKPRVLITPIPGMSTHAETDWLTPLTQWHKVSSWEHVEIK